MPEASGFCYSCGIAQLMSFVFDGVYDDYGKATVNNPTIATDLLIESSLKLEKNG